MQEPYWLHRLKRFNVIKNKKKVLKILRIIDSALFNTNCKYALYNVTSFKQIQTNF